MRKLIAATLLLAAPVFAESKKLEEAFTMLNQINITGNQSELMSQIKSNLKDAFQLSEKAQTDLLACLEREDKAKEAAKKTVPAEKKQ